MKLVEDKGTDGYGQIVLICGKKYVIHEYDWYMEEAISKIEKVACTGNGEVNK